MVKKYVLTILFLLASAFCFGQKKMNKPHHIFIDPALITSAKPHFDVPHFFYDKKIMNEECPAIFTELTAKIVDIFLSPKPPKDDRILYYFYVLK